MLHNKSYSTGVTSLVVMLPSCERKHLGTRAVLCNATEAPEGLFTGSQATLPTATCGYFCGRADVELRHVLIQSRRRGDEEAALHKWSPTCPAAPGAKKERILCLQVQFGGATVWACGQKGQKVEGGLFSPDF